MIRLFAALSLLALSPVSVFAQQAPAAEAPAAADIVIDPGATINQSSKQANMLTGFYATKATIELCALTLEPAITAGMDADQARLELSLGLDAAMAAKAYTEVKAQVENTPVDCAEGSADRLGVDAVTAIYADLPAPPVAPAQ